MTNKPLKIFISSTFLDLLEYRDIARESILRMQSHSEDMLHWTADERTPLETSIKRVISSDILILILAHRYGTVLQNEGKSITELEYLAAKEKKLPVLAFFVDPDFPWSPKYIDSDPDLRIKLSQFKKDVETSCVRQYFTTPETFAIALTQSLANFDRNTRLSYLDRENRKFRGTFLNSRNDLAQNPNVLLSIGSTPDGLQAVVKIKRSSDIATPIFTLAKAIGQTRYAPPFDSIERTLTEKGRQSWSKLGIQELEHQAGLPVTCYISNKNLTQLFSPTLLEELVSLPKGASNSKLMDKAVSQKGTRMLSLEAKAGPDYRTQSTGGSNRFLAIPISGDEVYTAGKEVKKQKPDGQFVFWRKFYQESLSRFSTCRVKIFERKNYSEKNLVAQENLDSLEDALTRILQRQRHSENKQYITEYSVDRNEVVGLVIEIAKEVAKIHKANSIHGDIKPSNILITNQGPILIDSLMLTEGEIAPAMTPGWAAPEQVAMQPVTYTTDIYPLALMLCDILTATLTGQVVTHIIPGEEVVYLLRDPMVYVEANKQIIDFHGRQEWLSFLENCLSFDASKRPPNMQEFIYTCSRLMDDYPVRGQLSLQLQPFQNRDLIVLPDGHETVASVFEDTYKMEDTFDASSFYDSSLLSGQCPSCGSRNSLNAIWCDSCGADIKATMNPTIFKNLIRCSNCGHGNVPGTYICESCGTHLNRTRPLISDDLWLDG